MRAARPGRAATAARRWLRGAAARARTADEDFSISFGLVFCGGFGALRSRGWGKGFEGAVLMIVLVCGRARGAGCVAGLWRRRARACFWEGAGTTHQVAVFWEGSSLRPLSKNRAPRPPPPASPFEQHPPNCLNSFTVEGVWLFPHVLGETPRSQSPPLRRLRRRSPLSSPPVAPHERTPTPLLLTPNNRPLARPVVKPCFQGTSLCRSSYPRS